MKRYCNSIGLITLLLAIVSCKNKEELREIKLDDKNMVIAHDIPVQQTAASINKMKSEDYPKILVENNEHDFGDIVQGDKVEHIFKIKNIGRSDLKIDNAQASCGCTVPEWTKHSISPGTSGEVKIIFDSAGKSGPQNKTITLTTNTEAGHEILSFKTNIKLKTETK